MALKVENKNEWTPIGSKIPYFGPEDLCKRRLLVDVNSLRPLARRRIASLEKKQRWHPHGINYLYFINLTILHEKLFRNFNFSSLLIKKEKKFGGS